MDLDAAIATATEEVANEQANAETTEPVETPAKEKDVSEKTDDELTPEQLDKRERNRESKAVRRLAQMKRQNRELQALLAEKQQPKSDSTSKPDPNSDHYKNKTWEEYNEDLADWKIEQKLSARDKESQDKQKAEGYNTWKTEQSERTAKQSIEAFEKNPEFKELFEANYDILESFDNTPIEQAFYEADNPELAAFALMKEGKLEDLLQMTPARAAMEIARAEDRGRAYRKPEKKATNAPAPMASAKGNSTGGSSLNNQTVDQLMKTFGYR